MMGIGSWLQARMTWIVTGMIWIRVGKMMGETQVWQDESQVAGRREPVPLLACRQDPKRTSSIVVTLSSQADKKAVPSLRCM